jgi:hypothetical protein
VKVILCSDRPSPALVQHLSQGIEHAPGLHLILAADDASQKAPATETTYPTIVLDHFIAKEGPFLPVLYTKKLVKLLGESPRVLVIDGSSDLLPSIDIHGGRAWEIPITTMKHLFWNRNRPAAIVHFCHPTMLAYYIREWSKYHKYTPMESNYYPDFRTPEVRVAGLIGQTMGRLAPYHPRARIRRAIVSKLKFLKFW